jgi:DNA-binding LytR/AlgR family response regulator
MYSQVALMKVAVCEDNQTDSDALCRYIKSYFDRNRYNGEISVFENGEALLGAFKPSAFDIYFLDIYLPGITGMDAARAIREADTNCFIIFITSSESHTMDGFMVQASGYVLKPLSAEKMDKAMHMCRQLFEKNSRVVCFPHGGENQSVSVADLLYVEIYRGKAAFHMKRGKLNFYLPLDEIEAKLGGEPFLRCHRSYLINMNHVADLRHNDFIMRNGDVVPIRKNGGREVRVAMANFLAGMRSEVF